SLYSLRWHPDGRQIATGSGSVWDSITGQQVQASIQNATEIGSAIDWSPSGVLAVGQSVEGRLTLAPNDNPLGSLISLATVSPLPSGTFPTTGVLDTFNRADGGIGSDWVVSPGGYSIASNQLHVGSGGPIYWNPTSFGADQEAFVTLSDINPDSEELD